MVNYFLYLVGPTEGIDVITIKDLPSGATRQGLADAVKSAVKYVKSDYTCEVKVVEWSDRSAKVHLSDMKGMVYAISSHEFVRCL